MRNRRTMFLAAAAAVMMSLTTLTTYRLNAQAADARTPDAVQQAKTPAADKPCYVQLFDDDNFTDDNDIIYGPGKFTNLRNLPGASETDWGGEADSLKVGPAATVKVYASKNFKGKSRTFNPGTEVPNLDDEFESMEITCR